MCEEGVDITEEAALLETIQEADQFLMTEISKLSHSLSTLAIGEKEREGEKARGEREGEKETL